MRRALLCALVALGSLTACSFTTASGFAECTDTSECGAGRVCSQNFCVAVNCTETYGATDAGDAIVLGAVIPFTTPNGTEDQSERTDFQAAVLALDEVNQRGVGNRKLALFACDSASDTTKLEAELDYLIDQKKVAAVLTSGSSQTLDAVKKTVPAGVLVMTATSTSPEITATPATASGPGGGSVRMLWRTAPSDSIQGEVIASAVETAGESYAAGGDPYLAGVTKVGILYTDDPYGQGLSEVVATRLNGVKTLDREQYPRGGDASAAVSALNDFDPDLTIAIGFPDDLVKILNQANTLPNLKASAGHRWFFSDAAKDPALLSGLDDKSQVEGALGSTPAQGAGPAYQSFASRFQTAYGTDPTAYSFTGHSYDAMYLLALGAAHAVGPSPYEGPVTGATIAEGLTHLSAGATFQLVPSDFTGASAALQAGGDIDVDGASGPLNFDPATGEAPSPIEIWRVSGTGFDTVGTVEPSLRAPGSVPLR